MCERRVVSCVLLIGLLFVLFCCALGEKGSDTEKAANNPESVNSSSKEEADLEKPVSDEPEDSSSQLATIHWGWTPFSYISSAASSAANYVYNVTAEVGDLLRKILKEEFLDLILENLNAIAAPGNFLSQLHAY